MLAPVACALPGQREQADPARLPAARAAPSPETRACIAALDAAGASFTPVPDQALGQGCSIIGAVQLHSVRSDGGDVTVSNIGPVACPVAAAFAAWARFGVDRAARQVFRSRLATIQTYGSYSCRNVAGTRRLSAHARAGAIDVAGFALADGRRISVLDGWGGERREREFLRLAHASACRRFDTILGPEYDAAHRNHFHLEGVINSASFCR